MMECSALHIYAVEAPRIESMEIIKDSAAPKKEGRDVLSIARRRTATKKIRQRFLASFKRYFILYYIIMLRKQILGAKEPN
jgi:hypothetical protein